ncbi:hypothetical protein N4T20_02620 [Flavobacterium sp. TR2]|uniref:hypothetical protein n=1 Tax=Flavobacterium sp. TR2 TaxID=2977321 RepID=UPI0021B101D1|nr:hypothetical protein [Flavobacterium sp. TR2]UWY28825.1 hypothetical protein N4T20_02620 [Flavobacterium sp. TR2]
MSLKIEIKSRRSKSYELQVLQKLRDFENSNISLHSFPDMFKSRIGEIPRASVGTADMFYRATLSEDYKKVDVWHLNIQGDQDRLLAVVTDDGKEYNPFNF